MIYLDTHVVVWLFTGDRKRLSEALLTQLEGDPAISPAVELELAFLNETGRLVPDARDVVADLEHRIGLRVCDLPFRAVVASACAMTWTRDPFDRLVVGHAAVRGLPLATKDRGIRANYAGAFWA